MTTSGDLLRMLEPTVRPGGVGGAADRSPSRVAADQLPFESRPFESLLADANAKPADSSAATATTDAPDAPDSLPFTAATANHPPPNPLAPLSDLSAVGNASLRTLIADMVGRASRPSSAQRAEMNRPPGP